MTFIDSFLIAIWVILKTSLKILSPIVTVIILWIFLKAIYRYKKYGIVEFSFFKKRKETRVVDMLIGMMDKIEGYRKIHLPSTLHSNLIVVDKTNLYLIRIVKYNGIVTGKREDNVLQYKIKINEIKYIVNPFKEFEEDITKIKGVCDKSFRFILVINNTANFKVDNVTDEVLTLNKFYYGIDLLFRGNETYNKKEINTIYKTVSKL